MDYSLMFSDKERQLLAACAFVPMISWVFLEQATGFDNLKFLGF